MKVKKSLETEKGTVLFEGEITADELDVVISVGLNFLLQQGAIPFQVKKMEKLATVAEGSEVAQ